MSFDKLNDNDLWNELFDSAEHSQLLNIKLLPEILDNIPIYNIVKYLINDINKYQQSKIILSRLKIIEILFNNEEYENNLVRNIIAYKYYRDLYKYFLNCKEYIIRWTIFAIFKNIYNRYKHPKLAKYFNLINKQFIK